MRVLAIISGEYGQRHVDNLCANGPTEWQIEVWQAPTALPPIVDYPEDFLPDELPPTDLILSFAEHKGVAELLPEVARMTGAQAVIAAVDCPQQAEAIWNRYPPQSKPRALEAS